MCIPLYICSPYSGEGLGEGLGELEGETEAETDVLTDDEGLVEAEMLELGEAEELTEVEADAEELGEREAEELEDGEIEAEGEIEALGDREREAELEGERELDGEVDADGEVDELGEIEALGDKEGEALPPRLTATRLESLLIGLHIAVNLILPAVMVAELTVAIISWDTIFRATPLSASTEASGELSTHISFASRAVPVVVGKIPPVVTAVPTSSEPDPVKSTSTVA